LIIPRAPRRPVVGRVQLIADYLLCPGFIWV
jgi:hypothetical protein